LSGTEDKLFFEYLNAKGHVKNVSGASAAPVETTPAGVGHCSFPVMVEGESDSPSYPSPRVVRHTSFKEDC